MSRANRWARLGRQPADLLGDGLPGRIGSLSRRAARVYREEGIGYAGKRLIEEGPLGGLRRAHPDLYWRVAPEYHRRAYTRDIDRYDAPLDPFKVESVDPARIARSSLRPYPAWEGKSRLFGTVVGGDWDRPRPDHEGIARGPNASWGENALFENKLTYRAFEEHFVDGVEWEEIDLIRERLEEARRGKEAWQGCHSPEEILEQCRFFDELYEEIRTSGFKSQRELRDRDPERYESFRHLVAGEVLVDVGRTGELLHVAGDHRTSIAKILGLETIPVGFLVRHSEWMAYRDRLYESGSIPDHPDLRDLQ
ncbi:hypothetical protein [Natronorarus salvus]|uniref:hypothetical protein n=1 Tax=Natronorarus salvus TaxID=3117733 RepID=UPI002F2622FA